jgi:glycosyltransferase involved in cell wall biosynthesis
MDSYYQKVSIVIPCYNQEKWIGEAIDSCLSQLNVHTEVIVIDDGSTDKSLEIIKSYGSKIIWETGPNRGVNPARNRGSELATGKYIRFLDADDLLEKNIIQKETGLLECSGADVCYGDWANLKIYNNRDRKVAPRQMSGKQEDMILWLLGGRWCPPLVYLYKRDFLNTKKIIWNVQLSFPDDFEFILRVTLAGARFCYLPEIIGYYRQYSGVRLSKIKVISIAANTQKILELAERQLTNLGRLNPQYKKALCNYYLHLAKNVFAIDRNLFRTYIAKIYEILPDFRPQKKWYAVLVQKFGYEKIEALLATRRKIRNLFRKEKF